MVPLALLDTVLLPVKKSTIAVASLATGTITGGVAGVATGRVWQKAKDYEHTKELRKEIKSLREEIEKLKEGNQKEKETRQARAVIRVAILKQVAWRDGEIHDLERRYIYDYLISCCDIDANTKVHLMRDLEVQPSRLDDFWSAFSKSFKDKVFASKDEKEGFAKILKELASADNDEHKSELKYIAKIMRQCGEPFSAKTKT